MGRRNLDQPQTLYRLEEIIKGADEAVEVGVLVAPDDTEPFTYVPFYFTKTISWWRTLHMEGKVTLNGEEIFNTGDYSHGFDSIERVRSYLDKIQTGDGVVTLTVLEDPIVLLPQPKDQKWVRGREYHKIPTDWINVSTPEGRDFFERYTADHMKPLEDRETFSWTKTSTLREERRQYSFMVRETKHVLWDSTLTEDENFTKISELLTSLDVNFGQNRLRAAVGLDVVDEKEG